MKVIICDGMGTWPEWGRQETNVKFWSENFLENIQLEDRGRYKWIIKMDIGTW